MKTATSKISIETPRAVQLERQLLPISEYAAREAISQTAVEELGKMGIVQVRKHKDKTYIVDVPSGLYDDKNETDMEIPQPAGQVIPSKGNSETAGGYGPVKMRTTKSTNIIATVSRIPDFFRGVLRKGIDRFVRPANKTIEAGTISQLIREMSLKSPKVTAEPADNSEWQSNRLNNSGSFQTPASEPYEITEQLIESANGQIDEIESIIKATRTAEKTEPEICANVAPPENANRPIDTPGLKVFEAAGETGELKKQAEPVRIIKPDISDNAAAAAKPELAKVRQDYIFQLGLLTAKAKSKRIWQIAAIISIVCLCAVAAVNIWLYMDRKIQLDKLDQAYSSIQAIYNDSAKNSQQVLSLNAQLESLQKELANSQTATKTLRNELTEARENLENIRKENTDAVKKLNEQIGSLSEKLTRSTKKR